MKKTLIIIIAVSFVAIVACKKSGSNNADTNTVQGTCSLTYPGKTIAFDTAYYGVGQVSGQRRIIAKNKNAILNNTLSSGTLCYFDVDTLSIGKHIHNTYRQFDFGVLFLDNNTFINHDDVPYTYIITSNTNGKLSGSFAFRIKSANPQDSARGTFKDISL
jgi:hypothetical protein